MSEEEKRIKKKEDDLINEEHIRSGIFFVFFSWITRYIQNYKTFKQYGKSYPIKKCRTAEMAEKNHLIWNEIQNKVPKSKQFSRTIFYFAICNIFLATLFHGISIYWSVFAIVSTFFNYKKVKSFMNL